MDKGRYTGMVLKKPRKHSAGANGGLLKAIYYSGIYFILNTLFDKKGVYILCYHRLSNLEPGSCNDPMSVNYRNFERHMEFLKGKYEFINMDMAAELLSRENRINRRYIAVTFDDGYRDNYLYGGDIFCKYNVKPTIYLTAGRIDQRTWLWHDRVDYMVFNSRREEAFIDAAGIKGVFTLRTDSDRRYLSEILKESIKYAGENRKEEVLLYLSEKLEIPMPEECGLLLDWEDINRLMETGADMGGHTLNHPILSRLSDMDMKNEVTACKSLIEKHIRKEVRHFAYPNGKPGDHTQETVDELKNHYATAATAVMGVNLPGTDLYALRRIMIGNDPDVLKFRFKLLQAKISQTLEGRRKYRSRNFKFYRLFLCRNKQPPVNEMHYYEAQDVLPLLQAADTDLRFRRRE